MTVCRPPASILDKTNQPSLLRDALEADKIDRFFEMHALSRTKRPF